jgi:hypothetical protein
MLKIQRSANGRVVFTLSGRIEAEDVKELGQLLALETAEQHLVLDLRDVTLVNQGAVEFLAGCEADSIKLENCPAYIREWIERVNGRTKRGRTRWKDLKFQHDGNLSAGMAEAANGAYRRSIRLMNGAVIKENLVISESKSGEKVSEEAIREMFSRILESAMFI